MALSARWYYNPNPFGGGGTLVTPGAPNPNTYINPQPFGGGFTVTTPGARSPYPYRP
jgi:hypothetical protein